MPQRLRSLSGYPRHYEGSTPHKGVDILLDESGDLAFDGDVHTISGIPALGQKMMLSLFDTTEDLYAPGSQVVKRRLKMGRPDLRGVPFNRRVELALCKPEITGYLDALLNVRTNEIDIEIDYSPNGDAPQVLRIEGLAMGPDATQPPLRLSHSVPIHRETLLAVEDWGLASCPSCSSNQRIFRDYIGVPSSA